MTSRNMSCTRAWLISTCGISEMPSGTSCTRATRASGASAPGAQKVVSLIQTDSRMTFSAKPKAWNISIERTLMPSAWPFSIGPSLGSTSMVRICGTRASWAARHRPAGPEPAISTSTVSGSGSPARRWPGAAGRTSGSPGLKPSTVELHGVSFGRLCRPLTISLHMICMHI